MDMYNVLLLTSLLRLAPENLNVCACGGDGERKGEDDSGYYVFNTRGMYVYSL